MTGVRWKHVTHLRIPETFCYSSPSALLGVEGSPLLQPHSASPKSIEFHGLIYIGRWEGLHVSLAGASFTLSLATLRVCCVIFGGLVQGLETPFGGPLMGHDTPLLFPGRRAPQLGSSAQWRMGGDSL